MRLNLKRKEGISMSENCSGGCGGHKGSPHHCTGSCGAGCACKKEGLVTQTDQSKINLAETVCPAGTRIWIEGVGDLITYFPNSSVLFCVGYVLANLTQKLVQIDTKFSECVEVVLLDIPKKLIKVKIKE